MRKCSCTSLSPYPTYCCMRVTTRGVKRGPKFLDLRKSPNPIRTSVGQPIFSWTIFGHGFIANLTQFSVFIFTEHGSVYAQYCSVRFSLLTSDREHKACITQLINAELYIDIWIIFGRRNVLDTFGRHFRLTLDFGSDRL